MERHVENTRFRQEPVGGSGFALGKPEELEISDKIHWENWWLLVSRRWCSKLGCSGVVADAVQGMVEVVEVLSFSFWISVI